MVAELLQQWSPSRLDGTSGDGGGILEDLAIPPQLGTAPFQGATRDSPVWGISEGDHAPIRVDAMEHTWQDSYNASRPDGGFAVNDDDDWEEQWATIVAEMTEDQELSVTPMDCGW